MSCLVSSVGVDSADALEADPSIVPDNVIHGEQAKRQGGVANGHLLCCRARDHGRQQAPGGLLLLLRGSAQRATSACATPTPRGRAEGRVSTGLPWSSPQLFNLQVYVLVPFLHSKLANHLGFRGGHPTIHCCGLRGLPSSRDDVLMARCPVSPHERGSLEC